MAQRQFRSDDTSTWTEKYGNGSAGAVTISANTADSARTGYANTTAAITEGQTALTAGSGTGFAAGDLVIIHQSRNGGSGAGAWELNKISSVGGGTDWTMAYAATKTYATTGQVYRLVQNSAITINTAVTLTGEAFDGTTKGIVALFCNGTVTITGNISTSNRGYRGGKNSGLNSADVGNQGEGTLGAGGAVTNSLSTSANGNGASGGHGAVSESQVQQGGSGGGNGAAGSAKTSGNGGEAAGNAGLTLAVFGGGGGSGGRKNGVSGGDGAGGAGGGLLLIIAKTITFTGGATGNGTAGDNYSDENSSAGGGGAGGSILLKGQTITLGTTLLTATGGAAGTGGAANRDGAAGAVGRIHADYSETISGTTTPTLDSTQDVTLADVGTTGLQSKYW